MINDQELRAVLGSPPTLMLGALLSGGDLIKLAKMLDPEAGRIYDERNEASQEHGTE